MLPLAYGRPCARCGKPMTRDQAIDLDHNDDGIGYIGFSHAVCNRSTDGPHPRGRGQVLVKQSPKPLPATRW